MSVITYKYSFLIFHCILHPYLFHREFHFSTLSFLIVGGGGGGDIKQGRGRTSPTFRKMCACVCVCVCGGGGGGIN